MPTWKAVKTADTPSEARLRSTSEAVRNKEQAQGHGYKKGGKVKGYHAGGDVPCPPSPRGPDPSRPKVEMKAGGKVPGKGNRDTVPARLTPGEFVVRKGPAQKNAGLLSKLNAGGQTRFRST